MKFKRIPLISFTLLVCLIICGPGVGASQENNRQDNPDQNNFDQNNSDRDSLNEGSSGNASPGAGVVRAKLFDGFLYFADAGGDHLKAMPKRFPSHLNSHELGLDILSALMAGPPNSDLAPTFPADTRVTALFISEDGRAWVDLGLRDGRLNNMDTGSELLAIYSLVNSLTLNIPGVKQVKLLVNGSDVATLGGHVSLKYFYKTNMLIVK